MDFPRSALAIGLAVQLAASPRLAAIGTVATTGAFRLNHATVRSNATLFEGALVETGTAPARMDLVRGARLELEPESAARFLDGHLMLERGAARLERAPGFRSAGFRVEARGVTIQSDTSAETGRIALVGANRVEVAALGGSFRVTNSAGMLVAKIAAGRALALEPQSTAKGAFRITGRLVRRGGHYLLTDETTNVTIEVSASTLTKPGLTKMLGQRTEVTGSALPSAAPAGGAVQVIEVAQVTPVPPAPGGAPADSAPPGTSGAGGTAPAGAGGAAGGAAGGVAVSVTMIAIVGGVAAAAVVGGLAASGKLGGSTAAPVSR